MSYEEFIQTPEGQRQRKFFFIKWESPVSKKEFERMFRSEEGKPGKYRVVISKIEQQQDKIEQQQGQAPEKTSQKQLTPEDFILQQLDLLDLDPQNLTDFKLLWHEMEYTARLRAEIIQATGGHPLEIGDLLNTSDYLPQIFKEAQIGEAAKAVTEAWENARKAQAKKTEKELKASRQQRAETSFRSQLEQRKREIEEILEKKRKEGEKSKGREIDKQKFTAVTDITTPLIENLQKQGFNLGENGDILLQLGGLKEGKSLAVLRAEAKRIERQLGIEGGESKVINQLRQKVDTLEELLRTPETVIQTSNQRITKTVNVDEVKKQLEETKNKLSTFENQFNTWADLSYWESVFETAVEINGQRKTVGEWLEEARKIENQKGEESKQEGKSPYEQMEVPQLETELSRVNVVLGYFDEKSLIARSERATRMSAVSETDLQSFYDLAEIQSLNPELHQIIEKVFFQNEDSQKRLLFVLEQAFGNDFIFPPDQSSQAYKDIIAFLGSVDLKSVKNLKDLDDLMKRVRMEVNNPRLKERPTNQPQTETQQGQSDQQKNKPDSKGVAAAESVITVPETEKKLSIIAVGHSEKGPKDKDEDVYFDGEFHFGEDISNLTQILKDVGILAENEDLKSLIEALNNKGISMSIVADGMGGHGKGEIASALATIGVVRELSQLEGEINEESLRRLVEKVNTCIRTFNENNRTDSGTTLAAHITDMNGNTWAVAVGDSRIYRIDSQNNLELITADQSRVWGLMRLGRLNPLEMLTSEENNVITSALDGKPDVNIQIYNLGQLEKGTRLILCCDGVWEGIDRNQISQDLLTQFHNRTKELIGQGISDERAREFAAKEFFAQLFKQFNLQGNLDDPDPTRIASEETAQLSRDNATAVVVRYQ
jgi:protein phosphatase